MHALCKIGSEVVEAGRIVKNLGATRKGTGPTAESRVWCIGCHGAPHGAVEILECAARNKSEFDGPKTVECEMQAELEHVL